MKKEEKVILNLSEIGKEDLPLVGGKGANLGEMAGIGLPVPEAFVITAKAYFELLKKGSLGEKIKTAFSGLDVDDSEALNRASEEIKAHILTASMPKDTSFKIKRAYRKLCGARDKEVAVRSSATAEDLPSASFAGQFKTLGNIKGEEEVVKAVQRVWASLFTPRAIFYREEKEFDHFKVGIAVIVQRMINSEVSGVAFTVDPLTNDPSHTAIEAVYGLGEGVVSGAITPDQYTVDKGSGKIISRKVIPQEFQITRDGKVPVSEAYRKKQKLSNALIKKLAALCRKIEDHYKFPQDIEWAVEGGKLYIVQTRPVTTTGLKGGKEVVKADEKLLLVGIPASPGRASGPVRIIPQAKDISKVKKGDVLVTEMTNPNFVPAMRKAAAIVTDKGGKTSHAAIVSRELGIPCVVGTEEATKMLKDGEIVTVIGEKGEVYKGEVSSIKYQVSREEGKRKGKIKTATKVYVNLGEPELAEKMAKRDVDGVGLLRAEFMVAEIGKHPRAFLEEGKGKAFTGKLYEGLLTFAKNFDPRPVIYRTLDLKTNEYRGLKGGEKFEGEEANPMLGFRGASRYIADPQVFQLELKAIKKVRRHHKNLWVMIPFVRTPEELRQVKKIMAEAGLHQGPTFKLYMMVEVPSNVIMLERFIGVGIDGISIGSNDLTQLVLGVDRDNARLKDLFNEMDPAVLWMIKEAVKEAGEHGISSSICGQAPSVYPEMVKELVKAGITSISVSPDAIEKVRKLVREAEEEIIR